MRLTKERDQGGSRSRVSNVVHVELRAKPRLIAQEAFEPGALDAMKKPRSDSRISERRRKQKKLVSIHGRNRRHQSMRPYVAALELQGPLFGTTNPSKVELQ